MDALFHDEECSDADGLAAALLAEGLPLVRPPPALRDMLLQHCVSRPQIVTPALVRRTLR
eukprot:SM007909S22008  [mRNA]  locus=s7909:81:562:+ [translate_table: standard]